MDSPKDKKKKIAMANGESKCEDLEPNDEIADFSLTNMTQINLLLCAKNKNKEINLFKLSSVKLELQKTVGVSQNKINK